MAAAGRGPPTARRIPALVVRTAGSGTSSAIAEASLVRGDADAAAVDGAHVLRLPGWRCIGREGR